VFAAVVRNYCFAGDYVVSGIDASQRILDAASEEGAAVDDEDGRDVPGRAM
jgi:hypothetical protein